MKVIKVKWNDAGSAEMLRTFFAPTDALSFALDQALTNFKMRAVEGDAAPFLGCGAFGRVFKVRPASANAREVFALKICIGTEAVSRLELEYQLLQAVKKCADAHNVEHIVVEAIKLEKFERKDATGNVVAAAMLMSPVAAPIDINAIPVASVLDRLQVLHETLGAFHGDARLPNILLYRSVITFCDLTAAGIAPVPAQRKKDVLGVLRAWNIGIDDKQMEGLVDGYGSNPTAEAMLAIKLMATVKSAGDGAAERKLSGMDEAAAAGRPVVTTD